MAAKIFPAARARILEIWDYTESKWGADQADQYVTELVEAIHKAEGNRQRWRRVADQAVSGAYFIRFRHHFILFRELTKGSLGVISVLHENMDIPARLKEDVETNPPGTRRTRPPGK